MPNGPYLGAPRCTEQQIVGRCMRCGVPTERWVTVGHVCERCATEVDGALMVERLQRAIRFFLSRIAPNVEHEPRAVASRAPCSCSPCPVPKDPEQRLDITCAQCGVAIDFRRGEVYVNGPSYVCRLHAANDQAQFSSEAR